MRISDWSSDVCSSDLVSLLWRWQDAVSFEPAQLEADRAAADLANRDGDGVLLPIDDQGCPDFETTDAGACLVDPQFRKKIGRAHVRTPVTNAHIVCSHLLEKTHNTQNHHNRPLHISPHQ